MGGFSIKVSMLRLISTLVLIAGVANAASIEEDRGSGDTCIGDCPFAACLDAYPIFCGIIPQVACGINFIQQTDCRLTCQQCCGDLDDDCSSSVNWDDDPDLANQVCATSEMQQRCRKSCRICS